MKKFRAWLTFAIIAILTVVTNAVILAAEEVDTAVGLQTAFTTGGEIKLTGEIIATTGFTVEEDSILDLNGQALTITAHSGNGIKIALDKTLTIKDSQYSRKIHGTGKLTVSAPKAGINTTDGTLIIESGVVDATGVGEGDAGIGGEKRCSGGTLTINGGMITAKGSVGGAGIGGGSGFSSGHGGSGGIITINGGTVTAIGGKYSGTKYGAGAGIGGGGSWTGTISSGYTGTHAGGEGGTITINGGVVTARMGAYTGTRSASDIGGGGYNSGTNFTMSGNAVVFASFITDEDASRRTGGILFSSVASSTFYSTSVTPTEDVTIPHNKVLDVPNGANFIISEGIALTNNGTIKNDGDILIEGMLINNGTINNNGSILNDGTITGDGTVNGNSIITLPDLAVLGIEPNEVEDKVTVTLSRIKKSGTMLIVAVYGDSELLCLVQDTETEGDTILKTINVPSEADTITAMLWEDIDGIEPLCKAKTVTKDGDIWE